jgi:hypothetical protein
MIKKLIVYSVFLFAILIGCVKENEIVTEQPVVELLAPAPCDTLHFGETFRFLVKVSDNTGLGNIKMDVHNNFGQHLHGDHEICNMDEPKDAVNPYFNEWILELPTQNQEYTLDTILFITDTTNFDTGDYHFHIYITDNEGYQTFTTVDVKIL